MYRLEDRLGRDRLQPPARNRRSPRARHGHRSGDLPAATLGQCKRHSLPARSQHKWLRSHPGSSHRGGSPPAWPRASEARHLRRKACGRTVAVLASHPAYDCVIYFLESTFAESCFFIMFRERDHRNPPSPTSQAARASQVEPMPRKFRLRPTLSTSGIEAHWTRVTIFMQAVHGIKIGRLISTEERGRRASARRLTESKTRGPTRSQRPAIRPDNPASVWKALMRLALSSCTKRPFPPFERGRLSEHATKLVTRRVLGLCQPSTRQGHACGNSQASHLARTITALQCPAYSYKLRARILHSRVAPRESLLSTSLLADVMAG